MIGEGKDLKGKYNALFDFMYERITPRKKDGEKRAISKSEANDWERAHTTFEYLYRCLQEENRVERELLATLVGIMKAVGVGAKCDTPWMNRTPKEICKELNRIVQVYNALKGVEVAFGDTYIRHLHSSEKWKRDNGKFVVSEANGMVEVMRQMESMQYEDAKRLRKQGERNQSRNVADFAWFLHRAANTMSELLALAEVNVAKGSKEQPKAVNVAKGGKEQPKVRRCKWYLGCHCDEPRVKYGERGENIDNPKLFICPFHDAEGKHKPSDCKNYEAEKEG